MRKKINHLLARPVIRLIYLYQRTLSPDKSLLFAPFLRGRICAHEPHCSAYGIQVLKTYGLFPGIIYMTDRITSCTPSHTTKHDPATLRVVFASSAPIGVPFLEKIESDPRYDLVGIITNPDQPVGRGMKVKPNIIKSTAQQYTQDPIATKTNNTITYTYQDNTMKPHENKKDKITQTVSIIIKHPYEETYIIAYHTSGWVIFPGGGIEAGETIEEAAIKEMREETGYIDIKTIKQLTGEVKVDFYHKGKDINYRNTDHCVYIELQSLKQEEVAEEEKAKHTMQWISKHDIMDTIKEGESHKIWRNRVLNNDLSGQMIDDKYIADINQKNFITTPNSLRLNSKKYGHEATELQSRLQDKQPDVLVVIAYGKIIPQHILDIPTIAPINVHGSLLPQYRGASPIQSVLLDDQSETGITIMRMEAGLDTGPMLSKKSFPLTIHTTALDIIEKFQDFGPKQLVDTIRDYAKGHISEQPQDDTIATHCSKLEKSHGMIDPRSDSLHHCNNIYRGCYLWPKAHFVLPEGRGEHTGKIITIDRMKLDDTLRDQHKDKPLISTNNTLNPSIISLSVKPENKKSISRDDFLHGYQQQ